MVSFSSNVLYFGHLRSVKELQVTPKTDVFAFGVVLSELITAKRALFRDNQEGSKMKSLISLVSVEKLYKHEVVMMG